MSGSDRVRNMQNKVKEKYDANSDEAEVQTPKLF